MIADGTLYVRDTFIARSFAQVSTLAALVVVLSLLPAIAGDRYVQATVDKDGQLRILTAGGQTIEPVKEGEQVGFAKPQISPGVIDESSRGRPALPG